MPSTEPRVGISLINWNVQVRFGVALSEIKFWYHLPVTQSVQYVLDSAKKAEKVGFDVISHQDHLIWESEERGCVPEMWTLLTALAATTRMTVSPLVMCNLFPNPAMVAKMVATIDQLSKGRVYLGVGAGWWEEEFKAYGYRWAPSKERVDRAIESTLIVKRLWTEEEVDFEGEFWQLHHCRLVPRPFAQPHPIIWNGGAGPRMLKMTGELCDGWATGIGEPDKFLEKKKEVLRYAGGRDLLFAHFFGIVPGGMGFKEAKERIEGLIPAGVTHFVIIMRPDASNMEMLDQCRDLISNFR
jgi:alkanesulfonate monooxygenase SsuD/methylene tetrahydromethanopterin reductase-like flavin-dependent oxidoreductase (luciferase family)